MTWGQPHTGATVTLLVVAADLIYKLLVALLETRPDVPVHSDTRRAVGDLRDQLRHHGKVA